MNNLAAKSTGVNLEAVFSLAVAIAEPPPKIGFAQICRERNPPSFGGAKVQKGASTDDHSSIRTKVQVAA